jgi:hypothetical protein
MTRATLTTLGAVALVISLARDASAQSWTSEPYFDSRIPQNVYGTAPTAADRQAAMEALLDVPLRCRGAASTFDSAIAAFKTRIAARSWQMPAAKVLAHIAMTERNMSEVRLAVLVHALAAMRNADAQSALDALHTWASVLVERFMSPDIPPELWTGVRDGLTETLRRAIADAAAKNGLQAP